MSKHEIKVAHSPDSDDAFMFYGLATDKIDTGELRFVHDHEPFHWPDPSQWLQHRQEYVNAKQTTTYRLTATGYDGKTVTKSFTLRVGATVK